jgi:putative DNA primase/helicase
MIGADLTNQDFAGLIKSFITPDLATQAGLRRVGHAEACSLLGRRQTDSEDNAGLIFPYYWPGETKIDPVALRLRRDRPPQETREDGTTKAVNKYLSKAGQSGIIYFGPGVMPEWLDDSTIPIVVTEGEKKVLALHRVASEQQPGRKPLFLALGFPGVYNWLSRNEEPRNKKAKPKSKPIAALDSIRWETRRVTILFDANAESNEHVKKAQGALAAELRRRDAEVYIARLPALPAVNGVDDFLALKGPEALITEVLPEAGKWQAGRAAQDGFGDLDNADRLIHAHGRDIRFCGETEEWGIWKDTHWCFNRQAKDIVAQKAMGIANQPELRHIKQLRSRSTLDNMVVVASKDPRIYVVNKNDFDSDPMLLNVANGTIDLRSGTFREHRREDLLTNICPVPYIPDAKAPRWEQFMNEVFEPHPDVIPLIKRAVGYSLTGQIEEHVLFFLQGSGRNGKGVFISILEDLLGKDYAYSANVATFMASKDSGRGPNEGLANLVGKRFVSAQEPDESRRYDVALLKSLTGGDRITTHRKYEHQFTFSPSHKLWITTNPLPNIPAHEGAAWSRCRLVPFAVSFEGREDTKLRDTLKKELPGILNWAIQCCLDWQANGLGQADSVVAATAAARNQNDPIARFIDECCEPGDWVNSEDLYEAYKDWAQSSGEFALSRNKFTERLALERTYRKSTVKGKPRWNGIKIIRRGGQREKVQRTDFLPVLH